MSDFEDRRYYQNEMAMTGLDSWITRDDREYDDGPDPDEDDRFPEGCCQDCGAELAFMGYGGSPGDTYEVYACPKCDLPNPPWTPAPKAAPLEIAEAEDEECSF